MVEENEHVKMGAFHTLDVEANRDVRIEKPEWDSISLERIEEASQPGRGAEVGAVVCGEGADYQRHELVLRLDRHAF